MWFGFHFVQPPRWTKPDGFDFLAALGRWDGTWYVDIAMTGYSFDPAKPSRVAFFPAYPLTIRAVVEVSGCRVQLAAILVAHLFLAASFVLFHAYLRQRCHSECGHESRRPSVIGPLLVFSLWPVTVFHRLAFTESMFVFWCVLMLFGYQRRWHPAWLALISGIACATRPPGLALAIIPLLALWQRSQSTKRFLVRATWISPLCVWGLLAYMAYQWEAFGRPAAFVQTQKHWTVEPRQSVPDAIRATFLFEPIWKTYDPGAAYRFWRNWDYYNVAPFSIYAANPIYLVLAVSLIIVGWRGRMLNSAEILLALGILLIPYVTKAYVNGMGSFGRFTAVAVPIYLVMGRLLQRLPNVWQTPIICAMLFWLIVYAILFGAHWPII